jgi:hypothetical protein
MRQRFRMMPLMPLMPLMLLMLRASCPSNPITAVASSNGCKISGSIWR